MYFSGLAARALGLFIPGLVVFYSPMFAACVAFAQSDTITTYAGPSLPANGALATTQAIDSPTAIALDGAAVSTWQAAFRTVLFHIAIANISTMAIMWRYGFSTGRS